MNTYVHKFGGTSLGDLERITNAARIIETQHVSNQQTLVVVSAMGGVTDQLVQLAQDAANGEFDSSAVQTLIDSHLEGLGKLNAPAQMHEEVQEEGKQLINLLEASRVARSTEYLDLISSFGEPWSARLLVCACPNSQWINAREFLTVRDGDLGPEILWAETAERLQQRLNTSGITIVTGFLAQTKEGQPTTLKRNGSDWTASILANLTDAKSLTVWKDVDGVMSTDPTIVPEAFVLKELSFEEAAELAYFGAKVLHPKTIQPIKEKSIPTSIRNSLKPEGAGTLIHGSPNVDLPVKGFTVLKQISLINVEGKGMIGVPGAAKRIFDALKLARISVNMISQSGSEQSICIAVAEGDAENARKILQEDFFSEIHHGLIDQIALVKDCALIAAVGDGMITRSGIAAKFCAAMSSINVSIRAIAQGSSERNISLVISREDCHRALRAAHAAFYLSKTVVNVGLIGPGQIGQELLGQMSKQTKALKENLGIDFQLKAIQSSKKQLSGDLDFATGIEQFRSSSTSLDLSAFEQAVLDDRSPYSVIVDCTASDEVSRNYPKWLAQGIHIVTPNKKANSMDYDFYQELRAQDSEAQYYYESTVGAGLPVISTLQDLIYTGDRIESVRGVLSGTLSFLFNSYDGSVPFSQVVREARDLGYTEPDPRDDLSGSDVARKLVILARESGLALEFDQISLQSLIPDELSDDLSVEEFLDQLSNHDSLMEEKRIEAGQKNGRLAYVAALDMVNQSATVQLEVVDSTSSIASIQGADNIIEFTTQRYKQRPLVIKGPGAGPAVTAAGVFSDLLRLGQRLKGGRS